MMSSWTIIIAAVGSIGWLLILREGLQRWSQNGLNRLPMDSAFQMRHFSKPLGRIRLVTVEWQDHIYCIAFDTQGAYVQLIDKHPIKRSDT